MTSRVHEAVNYHHSSNTEAAALSAGTWFHYDSPSPLCPRPPFAQVASAFR